MTFLGIVPARRAVWAGNTSRSRPQPPRDTGDDRLQRAATSAIRIKRAAAVAEVPDWPELRAAGAAINDALAHLDRYLLQLNSRSPPAAARARGGDAREACQTSPAGPRGGDEW